MEKKIPRKQADPPVHATQEKHSRSPRRKLFYKDKSVFGIDIGSSSMKVMQIGRKHRQYKVIGHGIRDFDPKAIVDGVITQPQSIANTFHALLRSDLKGAITTNQVAFTVPSTRCFIRSMIVPSAAEEDLAAAVQLEIEQYIPSQSGGLYIDFNVIRRTQEEIELLAVAVPKKIVNSYLQLADLLNLQAVAIEPTITANARLFAKLEQTSVPTILIDFGSISSDVMVFDQTLITASMVAGGGDASTALLVQSLGVETHEANIMKAKYGLSKGHPQYDTTQVLTPLLEQLVQEIKRILRYYSDHVNNTKQIEQIVIIGGGANMPGLNDYCTDKLGLPTRMFTPWEQIDFGGRKKPGIIEKYLFATVAGLALIDTKELFR